MKVNHLSFTYDDVVSTLENPFIRSLSPLEYGKAVQTAVEEYVTYNVNLIAEERILVDVSKDPQLMEQYEYSNNGPGFDRLHLPTRKKIQIKLRQVDGKTPFSKQLHFENTRRHSEKNKNSSADTGLIRYSLSEFDYVLATICHIVDGQRTDFKQWSYSLISSGELEDVNNKGYCLPHIPSSTLYKNKFDDIYMLTNKLKYLQNAE
jgi:hypothetical protein